MKKTTFYFYQGITLLIVIFLFTISATLAQTNNLRINEFLAVNQTGLTDEDGDYPDWIEIYNPASEAINLSGWALTDDPEELQKWIFPGETIEANGYLVVFASGKEKNTAGSELHTNFKLSGSGEYLALLDEDGNVVTEFNPAFPEQQTDVSYGYFNNAYINFSEPTPGADNEESGKAIIPAPGFSKTHGFFDTEFSLEITSDVQDCKIYYTTDGSEPSASNGTIYSSPVSITTTSVVRAVSIVGNQTPGSITTQTYIFIDDVINQSNEPDGYPAEWGSYTALDGNAIADYEMDPELMEDAAFADSVKKALLDIPTISIVTDKDNLFSKEEDSETGGIYIYTGPPLSDTESGTGDGWERSASAEYFDAQGNKSFQVDCGLRLQGGHGRRPEKSPKHSFRLLFKSKYGSSKLNYSLYDDSAIDQFNTVTLRAGFCNSFTHHSHSQRIKSQYIHDAWGKDTQNAIGHPASHGTFVHLYLNGLYWGLYNPTERIDDDFAASYLGGDEDDYDVIKDYTEVVDGNIDAWNEMMELANSGLEDNDDYQRIQGNNPDGICSADYENYVDVVNLIDYMIINFYGGNTDWDHHNWAALRNRKKPGKGFKFICWDEEHILESLSTNVLSENNDDCPSRLFQKLRENEDFLTLFADRVQLHCYNGGVLTPESAEARWMARSNEVERAIYCEQARWGDYRRDVHQYQTSGPFELYSKDHWLEEQSFLLETYLPQRTQVFLNQLRSAGLFPETEAPEFMLNDLSVTSYTITDGDVLSMNSSSGVIYYTTDGNDPKTTGIEQLAEETVLIAYDSDKKVLVPRSDIGTSWCTDADFDDSAWQTCSGEPGGIGYEAGSGYDDMISLDVTDDMYQTGTNPNTSCYIRISFDLDDETLSRIATLEMDILYDDGFIAWLNGEQVAKANSPSDIQWDSEASSGHEASSEVSFDISQYINNLVSGENILAIQGLNSGTTSSDFLISVNMTAGDEQNMNASGSAVVYSEPLTLGETTHVKARTYYNGEWSAINDCFFSIPSELYNMKITEIHYHPLTEDSVDNGDYEFIELKNTGTTSLDLSGAYFADGIDYEFPEGAYFNPGEFIVLTSDVNCFYSRYGFFPYDEYDGQLNNNGEWIALANSAGDTLCKLRYNDAGEWAETADGEGYSLVPVELNPENDQNDPSDWRASLFINGSPGKDDTEDTVTVLNVDVSPEILILKQNYPNPFSDITYINYILPETSDVQLCVYNIVGQSVKSLVSEKQQTGNYIIEWNGTDNLGNPLSNGIYFYRFTVKGEQNDYITSKRMMLMR